MKNAVKWISLMAVIAAAVLFCGCNNKSGEEIDLAPFPIETENTRASLDELRRSAMTPFIMPKEDNEEYQYYSSLLTWGDDCVPGQLYLLSKVDSSSEAILKISDRSFRIETGLVNIQPNDRLKIYAVAITDEGDCLLKIDQETGEETVLYSASGRTIEYMASAGDLYFLSSLHEHPYLYFSDGSSIMQFNFYTEEIITVAEAQVQYLTVSGGELVWQDKEGEYYQYDDETGENLPTTYNRFNDKYFYDFHPREDDPEKYDLYLVTKETCDEELIQENITNILYAFTNVITTYAQVGNEYIISVNNTDGDIETVYNAVTDDMELIGAATRSQAASQNMQLEGIYVRDGQEVVRVDGETLEAGTLFPLENGLSQFEHSPFAQDNRSMFVYLYDQDDTGLNPEDFYICEECDGNDLTYCVWADKDGNWFWYHPHSGDNEEIEVTQNDWGNYFIRQMD